MTGYSVESKDKTTLAIDAFLLIETKISSSEHGAHSTSRESQLGFRATTIFTAMIVTAKQNTALDS